MIFLSPNMDLSGLFLIIGLIMFGPPILLTIIGLFIRKKKRQIAKVLFIFAAVYLIISLGICGSMIIA